MNHRRNYLIFACALLITILIYLTIGLWLTSKDVAEYRQWETAYLKSLCNEFQKNNPNLPLPDACSKQYPDWLS
jgi:thiaminase